jgi:putative nucleotidyltransferase with HDIG domain
LSLELSEIKKKIKSVSNLPSLPMVVSTIVQLVKNPKTSADEITRVIKTDPSLTAKIFKLVNSAYYGFPREIKTLSSAIMILGFNDVKNLAMSATVFEIFSDDNQNITFSRQKLWQHSVAVAVTSRMLAERSKYREPEEVFIAGLLHDIGKIIIDLIWHDLFIQVLDKVSKEKSFFKSAEMAVLGITHAEIGMLLCEHWNMPQALCQAINFHHSPERAPADIFPVTAFIHAADVFTRIKKIGSGGDMVIPSLKKEVWYFLNLKPDQLPVLYEQIAEEVKKAESFFNINKISKDD